MRHKNIMELLLATGQLDTKTINHPHSRYRSGGAQITRTLGRFGLELNVTKLLRNYVKKIERLT